MTNREILEAAVRQSAVDLGCAEEDLLSSVNKVVTSRPHPDARKYLQLPFFCNLVSYGTNVVAAVDERVSDFVLRYLNRFRAAHCFETPQLHLLSAEFAKYGQTICFMAEYFLPDRTVLKELLCPYPIRILRPADFQDCYQPAWSNALCEKRKHLDVLAAAAYDGEKMIGLAGCSADCETMWQIGIDVLPDYRRQGVASALTSRLAMEVLGHGKVPFYCAAWSNIGSVRNAVRSGFRPAWVELTAVSNERAAEMCK